MPKWIIGMLFLLLLGGCSQEEKTEKIKVLTSFYPVYLLTEEIVQGSERIALENMADPQTGCLHDYTLTVQDMKKLESADILLINGGGMELFLEEALERYPHLRVVDTSSGMELLEDDHIHEEGEVCHVNGHVWLSLEQGKQQAGRIAEALAEEVGEESPLFQSNYDGFVKAVEALEATIPKGNKKIPVAIFHEGFPYLTEPFSMEGIIQLYADENQTPSAKELAAAVDLAKEKGVSLFLTAPGAGEKIAALLAEESGGKVLVLDPITNAGEKSYIERMEKNLRLLEESGRGMRHEP